MKTIAITGGIGSGKSTVTDFLNSTGYIVIDADKISRQLTDKGGESIPYILENFGSSYLLPDGSMNRAKMRDLVFSNPDAKKILEEGTTKVVINKIEEIKKKAEIDGVKYIFFDIPLLFELEKQNDFDEVWVVTAPIDVRIERIKKRDGINLNLANLIIGSQADENLRLLRANFVINNDGSKQDLYKKIKEYLKNYN